MKKVARALLVIGTFMLPVTHVFGQCVAPTLPAEANTLVIDTRPNEINKFSGRTKFKNEARIALINMNPFLYTYDVQVQQTEIKDTALFDFFKLLGSPLTDILDIASVDRSLRSKGTKLVTTGGSLDALIELTDPSPLSAPVPPATACVASTGGEAATAALRNDAAAALKYLADTRLKVLAKKDAIELAITGKNAAGSAVAGQAGMANGYNNTRVAYRAHAGKIFDPSVKTATLCTEANQLHTKLTDGNLPSSQYPNIDDLEALKADIATFGKLIDELKNSAEGYRADTAYASCKARLKGYPYADSLARLAIEMGKVRAIYDEQANVMIDETQKYDYMIAAIQKLKGNEDLLLQRVINVRRQYDISAFDVEVTPVELRRREAPARSVPADQFATSERVAVAADSEPELPFTNRERSRGSIEADNTGAIRNASRFAPRAEAAESAPRKTVASGSIGNRRFEISAGVVYSALPRREFQPVLGFARDEQGNLVDEEGDVTEERNLTNIVGVSEDSNKRLSPMALLHTRLTNFRRYNLFMSVGVTGKRDNAGTDIEYLFGPSVNFFDNRVFFTFGGYAGRQQRLAGDLFLNARLPDGADSIPIRKEFQWKPGFAFTYRFPLKSGSAESK